MKNIIVIATFLAIAALGLGSATAADVPTAKATVISGMASMPLAFTENQGQWDDQVLFRANAGGATMWFTKEGAYYQFTRRVPKDCAWRTSPSATVQEELAHEDIRQPQDSGTPPLAVGSDSIETMMIKANFVGSNPQPTVHGEGLLDYKCNYFLGNDPTKWSTDVPNYQAIVYQEVYPGIDLKYYGNGKQMEYDFIVSPGADPSQIAVRYEGAKSLSIDAAGRLVVETDWGEVIEQRPVVYQMSGGDRVSLAGEYVLKGDKAFGFELPDGYDASLALVIDPVLTYSTYLGGSDDDYGRAIAVDASGAAYVTGETYSTDFPTENPYQTDQGNTDVFVTKLSGSGSSLVYSTYLGGSDNDCVWDIAVDSFGAAYVIGWTYSTDFPTENPYQTDQSSMDVFVTKLSSSGSSLVYSTYLGRNYEEEGRGIAVDDSGAAYVSGTTYSTDFPTENPYQTNQAGSDVFVTKLSSSGSSLVYSTYLGGNYYDRGFDVAVDASGTAYVTGHTNSNDYPTENPYQTHQSGWDVFITKLSNSGSNLIYSTYLGGNNVDNGFDIAVDDSGAAYVTGTTYSTDFPTENPYQTNQAGSDVFITKLSSSGDSLIYSTYLGGSSNDYGNGIAVDASGDAYVTGQTLSTDFPTQNPYQTYQGYWDGFVTKLSSSGSSLVYSTYLGGSDDDYGRAIAVDASGAAYVTGETYSTDFPTLNPYQSDQGSDDVFVSKLSESCCNHDGIRGDVDLSGSLNVGDLSYLVAYLFDQPPGPAPPCFEEGDVDASGSINVGDLAYLVAYLFDQPPGPAPLPCP